MEDTSYKPSGVNNQVAHLYVEGMLGINLYQLAANVNGLLGLISGHCRCDDDVAANE